MVINVSTHTDGDWLGSQQILIISNVIEGAIKPIVDVDHGSVVGVASVDDGSGQSEGRGDHVLARLCNDLYAIPL